MKKYQPFIVLFLFIGVSHFSSNAQRQPGMVDRPGGGQSFNAEQYKIDRMKTTTSSSNNYNSYSAPTQTTRSSTTSNYEPGAGYMSSTREWKRKELEIDYRKYAKKAKSKETVGLSFEYPDKNGVEVTHLFRGIDAYNTNVFHNHNKEYDNYNNLLYDLYYSMPTTNDSDFGFGLQFITNNSSFHECDDYTFFSFFITAGGNLFYFKKKLPSEKTSGFFGALANNIPEMFNIEYYKSIPINAELKDFNLLTVTQWKNKLHLAINDDVIYEDSQSRCPVFLYKAPYNLFVNKGTVNFFEGRELYTEKKH